MRLHGSPGGTSSLSSLVSFGPRYRYRYRYRDLVLQFKQSAFYQVDKAYLRRVHFHNALITTPS